MAEFRLPDLGEGVTEAELVEWRVREGETVERDQILGVISTDKATVEIPSPFAGRVEAVLVAEGARIRVGDALLLVAGPGGPTVASGGPAHAPEAPLPEAVPTPVPVEARQSGARPGTGESRLKQSWGREWGDG